MSSTQAQLENGPSVKLPLECHQWMSDLWADLRAGSQAHDEFVNSTHARIIREHIDHLQPELQVNLAAKKSSLAKLEGNSSGLHYRTRQYQKRVMKVKENPLATIAEDPSPTVESELPTIPCLRDNRNRGSWIRQSLASIKQRARKIRQFLRSSRMTTGKRIGAVVAGRRRSGPSPAHLPSLSEEALVSVMLAFATKIDQYTRLLDGSIVDASFRPRVVEIVAILQSHRDNHPRLELEINTLCELDKEIQDHLKIHVQAQSLLAFAVQS